MFSAWTPMFSTRFMTIALQNMWNTCILSMMILKLHYSLFQSQNEWTVLPCLGVYHVYVGWLYGCLNKEEAVLLMLQTEVIILMETPIWKPLISLICFLWVAPTAHIRFKDIQIKSILYLLLLYYILKLLESENITTTLKWSTGHCRNI
jgi:hypothetical protein